MGMALQERPGMFQLRPRGVILRENHNMRLLASSPASTWRLPGDQDARRDARPYDRVWRKRQVRFANPAGANGDEQLIEAGLVGSRGHRAW